MKGSDTSGSRLFFHRYGWHVLIAVTVLIGCGVRLYAAWTVKYFPWHDSAVPMLMAKHFSEGEPLSVFYYGQAYMGSLEAWFSSLAVRMFGPTAYAVCLGTTGLSFVVLVWTVWMSKRIAGMRAAWLTSLWMLACSDAALYLSVHPRGGYMVLLVSGLGTVFFADRFFRKVEENRDPFFAWDLIWAGFFGGVGWWNLQLVVVYALAVVLMALPKLKKIIVQKALIPTGLAFLLGGLPWWLWNLRHGWASLSMVRGTGKTDLETGTSRFVVNALDMMGWKGSPTWMMYLKGVLGLFLVGAAVWMLTREFLRCREPGCRRFKGLGVHILILGSTFFVYATSHFSLFNTPRYLLPLYPSFSILAGVLLSQLIQKKWMWVPVGALVMFLLPVDMWNLHLWNDEEERMDENWSRAELLAEHVKTFSGGIVLGEPMDNWMTVASGEQMILVNAPYDAYAPYNRIWASADNQVILKNHLNVISFLQSTQSTYKSSGAAGVSVVHSLTPPDHDWTVVEAEKIRLEGVSNLHDHDLDTGLMWNPEEEASVRWTFKQPLSLVGLVIPAPHERGLGKVSLSGVTPDGRVIRLIRDVEPSEYFWSGSRVMRSGTGHHRLFRFTPPASGFEELILSAVGEVGEEQQLREVMLLEKSDSLEPASVQQMDAGEGQWMLPRFMADQWCENGAGDDVINKPSFWERTVNDLALYDSSTASYIPVMDRLSFLVDNRVADRSLRVLQQNGYEDLTKEIRGSWTIITAIGPEESLEEVMPVTWTEFGLFGSSEFRHLRWTRAEKLIQHIRKKEVDVNRAAERLIHLVPESPEAMEIYRSANGTLPDTIASVQPEFPSDTVFEEGLVLRGVTTGWSGSTRQLTIDWYWELPRGFDLRRWSLFVHFKQDGELVFQDDHNPGHLLPPGTVDPVPLNRVVRVQRKVKVPEGLEGGLTLQFGWLDPGTGRKISIISGSRIEKTKAELAGKGIPISAER